MFHGDTVVNYHFDEFSLDITNRQLMIADNDVTIDERAYSLLNALITAYPAECSKQDLMSCVWQGVVVSEWSLSKLVSDTRKAFKKAGYNGPLIQTVHGKGYRLEKKLAQQLQPMAAETTNVEAITEQPEQQIETRPSSINNNRWPKFIGAAALVVFIVLGSYMGFSSRALIVNEPDNTVARVLWVDDNPSNNEQEHQFLEQQKIGVYPVTTTKEALRLLSLYEYEVVISDMGRQDDGLAGIKLLELMRANNMTTPFLLYTWHTTEPLQREISDAGGQGVIIDSQSLYAHISEIIPPDDNN